SGQSAEITNRMSRHADAERRHDVVEEAVVVVRAEENHQLRIKLRNALPRITDHRGHFVQHLLRRIDVPHQRGMRKTMQIDAHPTSSSRPAGSSREPDSWIRMEHGFLWLDEHSVYGRLYPQSAKS